MKTTAKNFSPIAAAAEDFQKMTEAAPKASKVYGNARRDISNIMGLLETALSDCLVADCTKATWADVGSAEMVKASLLNILVQFDTRGDETEAETKARILKTSETMETEFRTF